MSEYMKDLKLLQVETRAKKTELQKTQAKLNIRHDIRRLPRGRRRSYQAAEVGRLTNDWPLSSKSPNDELYTALSKVRARARHLKQNNEYAKRYVNLKVTNVVGPTGVNLQVRSKWPNGNTDDNANSALEGGFKKWCKKGVCTVCGGLSFVDVQKMVIDSVFAPGELLVRFVNGWQNGFGFALRIYEADHLDEDLNTELPNGNKVIMGVERDNMNRVLAYWILKDHPGGWIYRTHNREHERVPADEMLLLGIPDRPGQTRFISPMVAGMSRAQMLSGYEEAELVAARAGSSKLGFIYNENGDEYVGDDIDGSEDDHDLISEFEPGVIERLTGDQRFEGWDPTHPTTAYNPFMKTGLRALASAWNVPYVGLANDLEGVSYSSIRQGELDARDHYRTDQQWLIDHFMTPVYEAWLRQFLTQPTTKLPPQRFDKFNAPVWGPRGWSWVDPKKEVEAAILSVTNGMKNLSDIAAEQGKDFEETLIKRKSDKELAAKYGIDLPILIGAMGATDNGNNTEETED